MTNVTISIPDPGVNSYFVFADGAQTINGVKTFSTQISIASGRTNSGKALNNEQVMILLGSEIIEGGTIGNGQIMIRSSILQTHTHKYNFNWWIPVNYKWS